MFSKDEIYESLKTGHWDSVFNWQFVYQNIERVAAYFHCTEKLIYRLAAEIEKKHPKPPPKKTWTDIAFKRKCRTCGELIGFSRTAKGNFMPVNLHDKSTHWACEKPRKSKRKKK